MFVPIAKLPPSVNNPIIRGILQRYVYNVEIHILCKSLEVEGKNALEAARGCIRSAQIE